MPRPPAPPIGSSFRNYRPGDALPARPPLVRAPGAPMPPRATVSTVNGPYGPIYPDDYVDPALDPAPPPAPPTPPPRVDVVRT